MVTRVSRPNHGEAIRQQSRFTIDTQLKTALFAYFSQLLIYSTKQPRCKIKQYEVLIVYFFGFCAQDVISLTIQSGFFIATLFTTFKAWTTIEKQKVSLPVTFLSPYWLDVISVLVFFPFFLRFSQNKVCSLKAKLVKCPSSIKRLLLIDKRPRF